MTPGAVVSVRQFSLRTEPHVAQLGDAELKFVPEVLGSVFLDHYEKLSAARQSAGSDPAAADPKALREITAALREFLAGLMLPESAEEFTDMELPDRVLVEMLEWVCELYGGGSAGARPTGSSSGSAPRSPSRGTRGPGSSPSKG